ncbi:hypothetical protein FRC17_001324 [Serendipita sp. 399]|nr:hypothetical protein FRC17_001324 [Serendipita sp. 399]
MSAPFSVIMNMSLVAKPFAILEKNGDLTLCSDMPQRFGGPDPCPTRLSFASEKEDEERSEDEENEDEDEDYSYKKLHRRFIASPNRSPDGTVISVELAGLDPEQPRLAALASEVLATAWSIFKISRTEAFKRDFDRIVMRGSCNGVNVLPHYFSSSEPIEGVLLALNLVALAGFVMLTTKLYKMYAAGMLKRVDGRPDMERHYRVILSFSSVMHLTAFFLLGVAGIFVDQLFIGRIRLVARHVMVYEIVFLFLISLTVPWLWIGLTSTRREHRLGMIIFFGITLGFVAIWGSMFGSSIYRFMFFTWPFFSVMSVFTCVLLVALVVLAVFVFLSFGLGLPEYLQTPIPEHPADKVPWMIEANVKKSDRFADEQPDSVHRTLSHKADNSVESMFSLTTSPGHTRGPLRVVSVQEEMPPIPLPAAPSPVLTVPTPTIATSRRRSDDVEPAFPPGLGSQSRGEDTTRLTVPKSRWSSTTVATEVPSTPDDDVSRRSPTKRAANLSRWSASTTATTTTNTSGERLSESEIPPVPELPQLPPFPEMPRLPQVVELVKPLPVVPKKNII